MNRRESFFSKRRASKELYENARALGAQNTDNGRVLVTDRSISVLQGEVPQNYGIVVTRRLGGLVYTSKLYDPPHQLRDPRYSRPVDTDDIQEIYATLAEIREESTK